MSFLRDKFANARPGEMILLQVEAIAFWLVGGLPGIIGYTLRTLAYKLLFKRLGGFAWVQHGVTIVHANRLSVGADLGCNTGTYINAVGGITMGDCVLIGSNVTISSGKHPIDGESPHVFARPVEPMRIVIEDGVWIAAGAVILPGIILGKGSVIGANAVVTSDTEAFGVYVGAPARKVRSRRP